jgi:hypothetical protein
MPYVKHPSGCRIWEGPRTAKEELELIKRINGVVRFPSANSRSSKTKTPADEPNPSSTKRTPMS